MRQLGVWRFVVAAGLIALTAILLEGRGRTELIPSRLPLSSFPAQLGDWRGQDIRLDKETLDVLGAGDFLVRNYQAQDPRLPNVDLFLAYFPSAGWTPEKNDRVTISLAGHSSFPANRYVISKGASRKLVLYWFWAHDRGVASEYWAKFYLVKDAIRMNRSDGALVRITADMLGGETADAAELRLLPFTSDVVPLLDVYIPR
jgi:hypothetical protein